jgi:hypothetical protein
MWRESGESLAPLAVDPILSLMTPFPLKEASRGCEELSISKFLWRMQVLMTGCWASQILSVTAYWMKENVIQLGMAYFLKIVKLLTLQKAVSFANEESANAS